VEPDRYKTEIREELNNILHYWMQYAVDTVHGGFYGKIDNENQVFANAPKGSVLNARILWTFSAAWNVFRDPAHLKTAGRAFEYIRQYFVDKEYGGVYWTVDHEGRPLDTKNQIYALAFVIYACSEYYRGHKHEPALELAISLYRLLEQHSFDPVKAGYLEGFSREWQIIAELRLSMKDANEKKTTNTHLHVLEAYANLYRVWPDQTLGDQIASLLKVFDEHIINKQTAHLNMFFDEDWNVKSGMVSYGHDIEASWLLLETAEILGDQTWIKVMKQHAVKMAEAVTEALDSDGGLWYEREEEHGLIREKHWWPQAEALVGFLNAWQLTGDEKHLQRVFDTWAFIKEYLLDKKNGEWYWGIKDDHSIMRGEDKAGIWKCPYHNSRACLETLHRLTH